MPHAYRQGDEPVPGSGYRLSGFLGRGGFGEVWKATAPGGAEAALKIIQLGGQEGRKEFRALQLVKRVRHPNLVPIIAFWLKGSDGTVLDDAFAGQAELPKDTGAAAAPLRATMGAPAGLGPPQAAELIVAMGLGDFSLFDRLEQCRAQGGTGIPPDELFRYMDDVAEAVDFLNSPVHELGSGPAAIQHCDIKPHNLMVMGGRAQICDFGLARMVGADRATTASATLAYAAPECLQSGKPSPSTDQYSLAVSYYELRTGALPYRDEALAAVMDAKLQGKLDFSRLTSAEQAVLRRATLRNPADRFPSAVALVGALREAFAAGTAPTRPIAPFPAHPRGRRFAGPLVAAALLAGAAVGGWYFWVNCGGRGPGGEEKVSPVIARPITPPVAVPPAMPPKVAPPVVVHSTTTAPLPPPPPGIDEADVLARQGRWDQAIAAYSDLLGHRPAAAVAARAHYGRGRALLEQRNYQAAVADFERAIALDPDGDAARKSRKACAAALLEQGTAALEKARLEQGTAALKKADYDHAIELFNRAGAYDPTDARIFGRRAAAQKGKGEWDQAIRDYTAAIDKERSGAVRADYCVWRGMVYQQTGQLDKALADFSKAVSLDSGSAAAYAHRGDAYMEIDLDRSVDDLNCAANICRENPKANYRLEDVLTERAACHMARDEYDSAAHDFAEAMLLNPRSVKSSDLDRLAGGFAAHREFKKAAKWERQAVDLAPDEAKPEYHSRLEKYQAGKP
jgi:tetratricopeptide (TPR) repeat protein